jgi:hypothetical protein
MPTVDPWNARRLIPATAEKVTARHGLPVTRVLLQLKSIPRDF